MNWETITTYPNAELEQKWFDFMPNSSFPSHYTSPGFFTEPFWADKNPFAVLVFDKAEVVGVLTGTREDKKILCGLEVRPQVSIAKDADRTKIAGAFTEALLDLAKSGGDLITIHCADRIEDFESKGFTVKKATDTFEVITLDLSEGKDAVFKRFSQSRRSDLRKAMRENQVQVSQIETLDELAELHEIYLAWCRQKGNAANDWETFKKAYSQKDYRRIFIAKHDGKIIAGSYFRYYKKAFIEYAANNSLPEYQRLRPNDLLVWKSIEWACEQGIPRYSMGGSHLFLRRFGGEPVSSYRYQLDRTFLKQYAKKEMATDFAVKTYQSLPVETRSKIKRMFGRM